MSEVNIVGAGLAGALLGLMLARRGLAVTLYERRPDPRCVAPEGGRSINLALAARGIRALEHAEVMDRVRPLLIPMRGRMVHEISGETSLLPYGQREHEVIYSVGRGALNKALIEAAARYSNVSLRFEQTCVGVRPQFDVLQFRDTAYGHDYESKLSPTIATDGAGSVIRDALLKGGHIAVREEPLDHDYKELTIPAVNGKHVLDANALHIWPRGGFMLIALPNTDGSFTATLFFPREGPLSFASLTTPEKIQAFFSEQFPDAVPLMPSLLAEFQENPQGQLGTVHAAPWHTGGKALLLGDAAHAIVPFHGQGMNAAFEDCRVLEQQMNATDDWAELFATFEAQRRPNAEAIANMALDNYVEMRNRVLDEKFLRQKQLALELERRFPTRFIPRYSMVMFHPEISYADAQRRGAVQQEILELLDSESVDFKAATKLIEAKLPAVS